MRLACALLASLTLATSALVASCDAATTREQSSDGVAFAAGEGLTLSWSALVSGRNVEACNGTSRRVSRLRALPTDFQFTRNGAPLAEAASLLAKPPSHGIPAGSCAVVRLRAAQTPDPGEYSGALLLVVAGGGVTRLPITITVPDKAPATPSGVSDQLTLSVRNTTPLDDVAKGTLLLNAPKSNENPLTVGQNCNNTIASAKRECPFIGNLYQGDRIMSVSVAGPVTFDENRHVQELPVELKADGHAVGDYEGTVTLAGTGGAPQSIKLKVSAKDAWGCAVIALLIGALLPLGIQLRDGRYRPKGDLERRRKAIVENYRPYHASGHETVKVDKQKLDAYAAAVGQAIASYAGSVVLLDVKSEAYVEIDAALKLAEEDAIVLSDPAQLGHALTELAKEVNQTTGLLAGKNVAERPELLARAAEPLAAAQMDVGDATERAKRAGELASLLKRWRDLASRVLLYAVWLGEIAARPEGERPRGEHDEEALAYAGVDLWGVRTALFQAEALDDFDRIRTSSELQSAFGAIAYLGNKYRVAMPPADKEPSQPSTALRSVGYPAPSGTALTEAEVLQEPASIETEPAEPVELPTARRALLAVDVLALIVTVGAAIIAGLSAFYFGKSFGTVEDYLTVIFAGTAAQIVSKAILDQLSLFVHDISPVKETAPATAAFPSHAS
jgi:hypothetical protein